MQKVDIELSLAVSFDPVVMRAYHRWLTATVSAMSEWRPGVGSRSEVACWSGVVSKSSS